MRMCMLFLFLGSMIGYSQKLTVNITGLRTNKGTVVLAFYSNAESFDKEQPLYIKRADKKECKNGTLSVNYDNMKSGVYGIAMLDDEDNNDKMDYSWFLPKEGFGFSGYYHTGLSKPAFDKFSFSIKNEAKTIEIKVRYM